MRSLKLVWVVLLACVLCPVGVWGQVAAGAAGTVTGTVSDQTGAVIAGATVTLTDSATSIGRTVTSNSTGLYIFTNVKSGTYDISATMPGFRKALVPGKQVLVGETLTVDLSLQVGSTTQTVEIKATPGAQLQTLNAAMGTSVSGSMIGQLPSIDRDVSGLLLLQPTAMPRFQAEGTITSGTVAGHLSDQTTFLVDGGLNSSDLDGNNGIYVFGGQTRGAVPTPQESVEEFKVNTNNQTVDFSTSGSAQVMVVTKRGSNTFHGSAYDWFQGQWLNSNDWDNNFHNIAKPKAHFNRFGGSIGGPMLPGQMLGGKTYFYFNYEGERFPRTGPFFRTVPSDLLRQGIIQIRDGTGTPIQYDMRQSSLKAGLTQCGPAANLPCDPRLLGLNPVTNQMWSQFMPEPNDFKSGDLLNTFGYRATLTFPLSNNDWIGRIDHDFGSKFRWFGSYRYYTQNNPDTSQTDIGGLIPGDTKGVPASASSQPLAPRLLVSGLTATFSPNMVNDFHFSFLRNFWEWKRVGALPQIPGIPGALGIGGESGSALIPININTQAARKRVWDGHDWDYRDTLSLLHGKHFFQFGGDVLHQWWHFDRYDNVVGGLTQLVYDVTSGNSIRKSTAFQPPLCTSTNKSNCIPSGNLGTWYGYLGDVLGFVNRASIVATRTGKDLTLNPPNTPVHSYVIDNAYSLYFSDAYHIKPNITLNYGLNWAVQMPPYDINGTQMALTDQFRNIVTTDDYLANKLAAANKGQMYNPPIGWTPVGSVGKGRKYVYDPFYGGFMPRVSLAWSPNPSGGFLEKLFGHKTTVIRGGYGRFFDRNLGIDLVSTPVLGVGFLQPVTCTAPSRITGGCTRPNGVDPNTAFRIGVDGNTAPLPPIPQTLASPAMPGINAAYGVFTAYMDSAFRPGVSDQIDFSIQRELKGNMILEVGWVGNWSKHLFQGIDIDDVPWMTTLKGQDFAHAYANLWSQLSSGKSLAQIAATPQPFLEAALAGSPYCSGHTNCTAAVADQESSLILTNDVTSIWTDLGTNFTAFGPPNASTGFAPASLLSDNQCQWCYGNTSDGISNYQALVISLHKRAGHGLSFNTNLTYSHALGTIGIPQSFTLNNVNNPWNIHTDYGPQFFDRKVVINWLGVYELPFGPGKRWASNNPVVKRLIGGWSVAPVFTWGSGLPLGVYTDSGDEFGNGFDGNGASAIPLINTRTVGASPHFGFTVGPQGIGANSDPKNHGDGVNFFKDPQAVFNSFTPCIIVNCGRALGAGQLRGFARWNLDFALNKETLVTERVRVQFFSNWFNALNHNQWGDPGLGLQSQPSFGSIGGGYGSLRLGGFGASANYGRVIQLGLRVQF